MLKPGLLLCLCVLGSMGSQYLYNLEDHSHEYYDSCYREFPYLKMRTPTPRNPTRYDVVTLIGCGLPPKTSSFANNLRGRNVIIGDKLELIKLPVTTPLYEEVFNDLPDSVKTLRLEADKAVVTEAMALSGLTNVRTLFLRKVRVPGLPPNLDELEIEATRYTRLPANGFNVVKLTVRDVNIMSLEGVAPRLKELTVMAPVTMLPLAEGLKKLRLEETAAPVPVPVNLREALSPVTEFHIDELYWNKLPDHMLDKAGQLLVFTASQNGIEDLLPGMFNYSVLLKEIDLSNNRLRVLPRNLFSPLRQLTKLNMTNNLLTARDVQEVALPGLKELYLSGNILGDLCVEGGPSALSSLLHLEILALSRTRLTRLCSDWLLSMRSLDQLRLDHNDIKRLHCRDLRVLRDPDTPNPYVLLDSNPIEQISCSLEDICRDGKHSVYPKKVYLHIDSTLKCEHDSRWLSLWFKLNTSLIYTPNFEEGECKKLWTTIKVAGSYWMDPDPDLYFKKSCLLPAASAVLDAPGDPKAKYRSATINGCIPPLNQSYASSLRALQVDNYVALHITSIQHDMKLSKVHFTELPTTLVQLTISASGGILQADPDCLTVEGLRWIPSLKLTGVHISRLPPHLDDLELRRTGLKKLPKEAYTVVDLTVEEPNLKSIKFLAPRLRQLGQSAPVDAIPEAPELDRVWLRNLTALRRDLFASSPKLREIDLRYNNITNLPGLLFKGLNELTSLRLDGNRLSTFSLSGLRSLNRGLKELGLSGNPTVGYCIKGGGPSKFSFLQQLEFLDLSRTELMEVCSDWLHNMPSLRWLRLDQNFVTRIPCTLLRVRRDESAFDPFIDLADNPIHGTNCTRDYINSSAKTSVMYLYLWATQEMVCDCSTHWMMRLISEHKVTATLEPNFHHINCTLIDSVKGGKGSC